MAKFSPRRHPTKWTLTHLPTGGRRFFASEQQAIDYKRRSLLDQTMLSICPPIYSEITKNGKV